MTMSRMSWRKFINTTDMDHPITITILSNNILHKAIQDTRKCLRSINRSIIKKNKRKRKFINRRKQPHTRLNNTRRMISKRRLSKIFMMN